MNELNHQEIVGQTITYVKDILSGTEAGHNWFHTEHVWKNAILISANEKGDKLIIELAALLHDIADSKFHNGDEEIGPRLAKDFLGKIGLDPVAINHITDIIRYMSFRSGIEGQEFTSPELKIVQDADRLDAIGAIGIARAFHFGGFKNRELYDPSIKPQIIDSKEAYKSSKAPTINHFYEKLLLLKDRMHTETARRIAEGRHKFMEDYLKQFYGEWEGQI